MVNNDVCIELLQPDPEKPLQRVVKLNDKWRLFLKIKPKDKLIEAALLEIVDAKPIVARRDYVQVKGKFIERLKEKKKVIKEAVKVIGKENEAKLLQVLEEAIYQLRDEYFKYREEFKKKREEKARQVFEKYRDKILEDPLEFAKSILDYFHVGDDNPKRILILIVVSGRNREKNLRASPMLLGPPSSGKSNLEEAVMKMLPSGWYFVLTRITPHAFERFSELIGTTNVDGKIFFITEYEGIDKSYTIRISMTEGNVTTLTVEHNEKGRIKPKIIKLRGVPIFITTSTRIKFDEQWLSRVLPLSVDESEEQTRRVVNFIIDKYTEGLADNEELRREVKERITAFKYFLKSLNRYYTVLSKEASNYLKTVISKMPDTTYKRRITEKVIIALAAAHALLNQHRRRKKDKYLYVEVEDAEKVIELIKDTIGIQLYGYTPRQFKLFSDILSCIDEGNHTYGDICNCLKRKGYSYSVDSVRKFVQELERLGYVEIDKSGNRHKIWRGEVEWFAE